MSSINVQPVQGPQGPVVPKSDPGNPLGVSALSQPTDLSTSRWLPGGDNSPEAKAQKQADAIDPYEALAGLAKYDAQQEESAYAALSELGYRESMEAKGVWENTFYGAESAVKSFGDALFNAGAFVVKAAHGAAAPLEGRSFVEGYEEAASIMQSDTGTRDPGLYDTFAAIGKDIGLVSQDSMDVGSRRDALLRARLGNAALLTETAGFIASFAVGGGANLGKLGASGGQLTGKAVGPIARMMARPAERALVRLSAKNPAEAAKLLESGKAWQMLTSTPDWAKSATMLQRAAVSGGRGMKDLMSLTGANIVQSYAMGKDEDRMAQLAAAAYMSPALLPIGKIGTAFAQKIAGVGMDLPSAKMLQGALQKFESGQLSAKQLSKQLWSSSNPAMRGLGNAVASSFEGTMFMGLSPEAHDLFGQWMGGDMDAAAKLQAMWLGSIGGIAVAKGLVPGDLAPLFKRIRPDANTLDLYIQAESNRRSTNEKLLTDVAVKEASKAFQNPQDPTGGISTQPTFINNINVKKGLNPQDVSALDAARAKRSQDWKNLEAESLEMQLKAEMDALDSIPLEQQMAAMEVDTRSKFGWATESTTGLLRSGWEPTFASGESTDVHLTFGRDHAMFMSQEANGDVSLTMPTDVVKMLSDVGALPGETEVMSPSRQKLTGDAAREALHNLSLISVARQQEFAITAERLGMEEVMPGVYSYPNDPMHHYAQLDGTVVQKTPMDNSWLPGKIDMQVVGGLGEPVWSHPTVDLLGELLHSKAALAPERLVDNALAQSIQMARYGRGGAAEELRAFFETLTPEQVQQAMQPGADDFFAFDLGSLGSGMNNAHQLMMERHSMGMKDQLAQRDAEVGVADDMAEAIHPTNESRPKQEPKALMESLSDRLQAVRDRGHREYRESMEVAAEAEGQAVANPNKQNPEPASMEGETAFRKQDMQRERLVERAKGLDPDASTSTRISGRQVKSLERFIPKDSDLGKQIQGMKETDARDVTVTAEELRGVVKGWVKYAPTERQKQGSTKETISDHQSADAWVTNALDGMGAKPAREGFDGSPRFIGISEQLGSRLRIPKRQPRHESEAPPQDFAGSGWDPHLAGQLKSTVGKSLAKGVDFMARDMADVLQRKGVEFGPRLKKARSRSGEIEGRALEHSKKLQELQSGKTTKAEFKELLDTYHSVGDSETMQRSRFAELIDGRVEPATDLERAVAKEGQAFNASLRDSASDAGSFRAKKGSDGETYYEPIRKDGRTVSQHVEGKDLSKVMDNPKLRKAFMDELAAQNELWTMEDGQRRRVTGDDLVNEWVAEKASEGKIKGGADKKSAVEFSRRFHNYPEVWKHGKKSYEIQEPNVWDRMKRSAHKQAGRAAMIEEFGFGGGEVDGAKLRKIGEAQGWSKEHLSALEKGGVEKHISDTYEALLGDNVTAASEAEGIKSMMDLLASREQAVEPISGLVSNDSASRIWAGFQALRSSALSSLSFLRDIPDLARGLQFTGVRRNIKAIAELAGDTKEFTHLIERDGILMQQMGDWIHQEARGPMRKMADAFGTVANKTERGKAILAAKQMELLVRDWNAGKSTDTDAYLVETLLGLNVKPGQAIEGPLKVQVMREGTEFLTSRARKGSYSKFADDPRTGQILLFQRFATKRFESHLKVIEGVYSTAKQHGWLSKQNNAALKTAVKTALGVAVAGVMGDWLIESLIGAMTEGNGDGFQQFYNEATASSWAMVSQLAESVKNQTIGGPAATVTRMFSEPGDVRTWTDATSPGALAHALVTFANELDDPAAGVHLMVNSGIVPARRLFASWARSAVMGKDEGVRRASLQVWNWRRENDLMPASGGSKTRPEEFYDAVGSSIRSLVNNGMDSEKALQEASEAIRKALDLAPSESVAASIRGHRMVATLTPKQRQDLYDSINDPERIRQILQFDEALSDMARSVSRMEGTSPSDFEATMSLVAKQAAMGSSDQWREVVDMALDATMASFDAGGRGGAELQELSRHLTMYPEHLDQVFTGRLLQAVRRKEDSMERADLISRLLYRRARERQRDETRKASK